MAMIGYLFLGVIALGILGVIWDFLKSISGVLADGLLIIGGVCLWLFGAPQAAMILGMNEILAYILFGIVDFIICLGIYAEHK